MKVYVFGNEYAAEDRRAIEVARELEGTIDGVSFVFVDPNEDVPFVDERHVVILDTVEGIREVAFIGGESIDGLILSPRGSVHDFDLAFQLRYLKKLGKLGKVTIIGIPQEGELALNIARKSGKDRYQKKPDRPIWEQISVLRLRTSQSNVTLRSWEVMSRLDQLGSARLIKLTRLSHEQGELFIRSRLINGARSRTF